MSADSLRETLEQMDRDRLLATATFFASEYNAEGRRVLDEVARSRGITADDLRAHRERCHPGVDFEFQCEACRKRLTLVRSAFVEGGYVCPYCQVQGAVPYDRLQIPPAFARFESHPMRSQLMAHYKLVPLTRPFAKAAERMDRREAILDGSYWDLIRELVHESQRSDPGA